MGVTRAPAWVGETDAEQLAGKLAGDKFKSSGTPDADLVMKKQQIQLALRGGDTERAETMMDELQANDQLTSAQRKNLMKGSDRTYLENAISHLDANEAMRVFKVADPKEREAIGDSIQKKIDKAHLPEDDRERLQAEFDKLMPVTRDIDTTLR